MAKEIQIETYNSDRCRKRCPLAAAKAEITKHHLPLAENWEEQEQALGFAQEICLRNNLSVIAPHCRFASVVDKKTAELVVFRTVDGAVIQAECQSCKKTISTKGPKLPTHPVTRKILKKLWAQRTITKPEDKIILKGWMLIGEIGTPDNDHIIARFPVDSLNNVKLPLV